MMEKRDAVDDRLRLGLCLPFLFDEDSIDG